ncbi:MAG: MBL fold metallo-hydrolase [Cyanobacteriota bacterium]|nr:MBL fold metallo-hydrolase [Cyanobacteriota bacterium]
MTSRCVHPDLEVFPPNRPADGGSAWLLRSATGLAVLVDVPELTPPHLERLRAEPRGVVVLTHRRNHGGCRQLQRLLGWPVVVQEQEAYLLPQVEPRQSFAAELELEPGLRLLWTPGPTPGSCVLHWHQGAHDVLFCGRLLLPAGPGEVRARPGPGTFHWPRQRRSLGRLLAWLPPGSPAEIACGAGLGALDAVPLVPSGRGALEAALATAPPGSVAADG